MPTPKKHLHDFALLLRSAREEAGITQRELANMTGLDPATISRAESGKIRLSIETGQKVLRALGIPRDVSSRKALDLLEETPHKIDKAPVVSKRPSRKEPNFSFGALIKDLRKARGITQIELAARVGVSRLTLRDWEAGRHQPTSDSIDRLGDILNVNPRTLRDPKGRGDGEEADLEEAVPTPDFDVHFAPEFSGDEVKEILTALAAYYRACGGVGFGVHFQHEEALVEEPVNA